MHRLKDHFRGERAIVIFGGPSIIENGCDLSLLDQNRFVVFLESKALTPYFLSFGLRPRFFLMFYPEKCKANSFQTVVFQSLSANINLRPLVHDHLHSEIDHIAEHFNDYVIPWKASVPHKQYRWRPDVYLEHSPLDLLSRLGSSSLITYVRPFREYFTRFEMPNQLHSFDLHVGGDRFSLNDYYNPILDEGRLKVCDFRFTNSAAIALFPLLSYMGFRKVYFLGMDMSMLGTMEYAALYTFRSLEEFAIFFDKARPVFSAQFPQRGVRAMWRLVQNGVLRRNSWAFAFHGVMDSLNRRRWRFMRPRYEVESLGRVLAQERVEFVNVYETFAHARPLRGVRNISFRELLNE